MNEAIKLAIEKGGYPAQWDELYGQAVFSDNDGGYFANNYKMVLDPLFWQALGKALGWGEIDFSIPHYYNRQDPKPSCILCQAHIYFDLVLTGGDTKQFWKDLLPPAVLEEAGE